LGVRVPPPAPKTAGHSRAPHEAAACREKAEALRAKYGLYEHGGMAIDLYAGIPVNDYTAALAWYQRLLGSPPTFFPSDTEAVWELAQHRSVFIEQRPEHAGHAMHTIIVDRGLEPTKRETYSNGVRKVIYCDPDGNEIGFGGVPR
jgi:hypothetical protein